MIRVAIITKAQADELRGLQWAPDNYYAPVLTQDGWVISRKEVEACDIEWVCRLPLTDFRPLPVDIP